VSQSVGCPEGCAYAKAEGLKSVRFRDVKVVQDVPGTPTLQGLGRWKVEARLGES
jgi:hypothetical protein